MDRDNLLDDFRSAMRHVAGTVYAVTTGHAGERFGIIATAVSSLSFDPPSLLVCINRQASLHGPMACADVFCINVLSPFNRDVAERFVQGGKGEGRFDVGDWGEEHGVPVLSTAQSSLVCRVADRHDFGTHTIFIGELIAARHRHNVRPLTWYDGRYIDISEAPSQAEE
jgi:flavin reductase (DIM6/NTAB) family NADH-FMN oxidoreductase RutF